ncbi:MAG: EAL domain-containing protein [Pseudomonadota bacterium]
MEPDSRTGSPYCAVDEALVRISAEFRSGAPVDERLQAILETLCHSLGVQRASLWLLKADGLHRRHLVTSDPHVRATGPAYLSRDDIPRYYAALEESTTIAASSLEEGVVHELAGSYASTTGVTALMDAPVVQEGRLTGVLSVEAAGGPRSWQAAEQRFITVAADLVAGLLQEERHARAEKELTATTSRLQSLTAAMSDAVIMEDAEPRVVFVNAAARQYLRRFGIDRPEGMHCCDVVDRVAEYSEGGDGMVEWARQVIQRRETQQEVPLRLLDGTEFEIDHLPVEGESGVVGHLWQIRDVTERRRTAAALERQRNLYRALSTINQAVIRGSEGDDPGMLLDELCRVVVEHAGLALAWIGEAQSDGTVKRLAAHGPLCEYLEQLHIRTEADRPEGNTPTGRVLRSGEPVISNDLQGGPDVGPWRDLAARAGVHASAAFRIPVTGSDFGTLSLSVYALERDFFDDVVVQLIEELVADVGYALTRMERERAYDAARAERDLLAEVVEYTPDYIGIADAEGREVYRNATAREWSQLSGEEGRSVRDAHPRWAWEIVRDLGMPTARQRGIWQGETAFLDGEGHSIPVSQVILAHRDGAGEIRHYSTVARDIRDLKAAYAEIQHQAHFDPVTRLPNRQLLRQRLDLRLTEHRIHGTTAPLLFVDLDRFKDINDALGHAVGDRLLRTIGRRLQRMAGPGATVARLAADEFIVLPELSGADPEEVRREGQRLAEQLHQGIARAHRVHGHGVFVEASIGVACYPDELEAEEGAEALLTRADVAMYEAKGEGGGARLFESWMLDRVYRRHRLESRLRWALDQDELHLHYQPQVSLAGEEMIGAEALIRWQPAGEDPISPGEFIPVAEESGLVIPLGERVLDIALGTVRGWLDRGCACPEHGMAVNVSPHQFRLPDFVQRIEAALMRHGVPPEALTLEITEGAVVRDLGDTIAKMNALRELGVTFSMDDFGTGYSSLSQLRELPLDTLKVDRAFIRDVDRQPRSAALVGTILDMARHMGLYAIAEGVETPAERAFVAEHGCDAYQGFLYARPLPPEEFARWVGLGY